MTYEETVCEERNNGGNRITRNVNRYVLLRQKERKRTSGEVSFIDPCHLVEMEVETNVQSAQTEENENESNFVIRNLNPKTAFGKYKQLASCSCQEARIFEFERMYTCA